MFVHIYSFFIVACFPPHRKLCDLFSYYNVFLIMSFCIPSSSCRSIQLYVSRCIYLQMIYNSEFSGLQPVKYAVRPVFRNILIIFSTCKNIPGSTADKIRLRPEILQFPGLTTHFFLPVPKNHRFIPFFPLINRFSGLTHLFLLCRPAPASSRLSHKRFL